MFTVLLPVAIGSLSLLFTVSPNGKGLNRILQQSIKCKFPLGVYSKVLAKFYLCRPCWTNSSLSLRVKSVLFGVQSCLFLRASDALPWNWPKSCCYAFLLMGFSSFISPRLCSKVEVVSHCLRLWTSKSTLENHSSGTQNYIDLLDFSNSNVLFTGGFFRFMTLNNQKTVLLLNRALDISEMKNPWVTSHSNMI